MLSQKSYYRKDIETRKVMKSKEKIKSLSRKKYGGGNFTPTNREQLRDQNTSMGVEFIELTEPFHTLNYKSLFKHCILQSILRVFLLFIFVCNKIFCFKN